MVGIIFGGFRLGCLVSCWVLTFGFDMKFVVLAWCNA